MTKILVKSLPSIMTTLSMVQEVIPCLIRHHRQSMLQKYVDEGKDLRSFQKGIHYYHIAAACQHVEPTTPQQ